MMSTLQWQLPASMNADFKDSHERHFSDATQLYSQNLLPNADHLFGISAECGLKTLMKEFGMQMNGNRPSDKSDQVHANHIWSRYETYRSHFVHGNRYTLSPQNPFHDWDASQRYAHRSNFTSAIVMPHNRGAAEVNALVKKAILDGIVT